MTGDVPHIMGVRVRPVEMDEAVDTVISAAIKGQPLSSSALAVHGLVLASGEPELRYRINSLDLVVPDGQPLRWALNWIHDAGLKERVVGPEFMWRICEEAQNLGLPIFLFGTSKEELRDLEVALRRSLPDLVIAGRRPSRFRPASESEADEDITAIRISGAKIVFVGLGCPRQEIWTFENVQSLGVPVIAVGAAFDYHAGRLRRAPGWASKSGLEWVFRVAQEPRRLWRRYATTNPRFIIGVAGQRVGRSYDSSGRAPVRPVRPG